VPEWFVIVIVIAIALAIGAAVAFGRKRQPCAIDPRTDD